MTLIVEMNPKVCAVVCTMFHKTAGCQAPRTAYLRGDDANACPVGKDQAEEWYRRPGRNGK